MKLNVLTLLFALTTITSFSANNTYVYSNLINETKPVVSINQDSAPISLLPATVEISVKLKKDEEFKHAGTGWLYSPTEIVTAKHVIDGYDDIVEQKDGNSKIEHFEFDSVRVTFSNGKSAVVSSIKKDKTFDVAKLIVDSKDAQKDIAPLKLASEKAKVGERLFGAGFPYDYECLLLVGFVTGYHTETENIEMMGKYMVTNAMFAPGNSGGPLVNAKGEVIGIVDWIDRRSSALSFAVPVDVIKEALDKMK